MTNPAASTIYPWGDGKAAALDDLFALPYRTPEMTDWLYLRDAAGHVAHIRLPDTLASNDRAEAEYVLASRTDFWAWSGVLGKATLRHYRLSGTGPLPDQATLVSALPIGDYDTRPGGLIRLASGALAGMWYQHTYYDDRHVDLGFLYVSPQGTLSSLFPVRGEGRSGSFVASEMTLAQHPADRSVWAFYKRDSYDELGAVRLTEDAAGLRLDWIRPDFIAKADGLNRPEGEYPYRTATPSETPTRTPTVTATHTPTATATRTATPSETPTRTATASWTPTSLPTRTRIATPAPTDTLQPTPTPGLPACLPHINTTRPIGEQPKAVAASADGVYTALYASSQLVRTDRDVAATLWQAATRPGGANGAAVWNTVALVTNRDHGSASLLDARTGATLAEIPTGSLPWGVAAAAGRAYVANFGANSVSVVDLNTRRLVSTAPVLDYPVGAVADADGAYIVHLGGFVTRLDPQGRRLAQTDAGAPDARGIALDPLRDRHYVGSREGFINVLNAQTLQAVDHISLPGPVYNLTVNPITGRLFAVDAVNNRLHVSEPDGAPLVALSLPAQDAQQGGMGIAAWHNRIYVASYAAGSLTLVDDTTCPDRLTPTPTAAAAQPAGTGAAAVITATAPAPARGGVNIGDLDATRASMGREWKAVVSVTALDAAGRPVANAAVSGTWRGGFEDPGMCITDAAGQCSVETATLLVEYDTSFTV